MSDFIEREKALDLVELVMELVDPDHTEFITRRIRKIQAADVKPVVHAEWVIGDILRDPPDLYVCSACGETPWWCGVTEDILPLYCPHCGAQMEIRTEEA